MNFTFITTWVPGQNDFTAASAAKATSFKKRVEVKSRSGFTLIETLVAIAILLLAVSGIMRVIFQGSLNTADQQDRITTNYLASEAIEYLRYGRDSAYLSGDSFADWKSDVLSKCGSDSSCQIKNIRDNDINIKSNLKECSGGACDLLEYNDVNYRYGHDVGSGGTESRFRRTTRVDTTDSGKGVEITTTVSWKALGGGSGNVQSVIVRDILYNYKR